MKLTNAYKRPILKRKKRQVLQHIERVLIKDKEREKEEKILIKKYNKEIGEAITNEDELGFSNLIREALEVLDERDVRRIESNLDISSNPVLSKYFNTILKEARH